MISKNDYKKDVKRAKHFLNGNNDKILKDLYRNMDKYSQQKDYERAILLEIKLMPLEIYKEIRPY